MAVTIDQIDVAPPSESATSNAPQTEPAKPDPSEIERALNQRRERLARVRAH
jgi:hypothetical protein